MKEALQKFGERLKRYGKEAFYFLTSVIFLRNFGGILLFAAFLLFALSSWMRCYTNHGESLQVHDYVGMQLDDVIKKAEDRSFEIIITDSLFIVGRPPNTVLEQSPKALSRVKKNRKIYLTVTKSTPDKVLLPDLAGGNDDYNQYSRRLKRLSLDAEIIGRRFSNKLEKNTILEVIYEGETISAAALKEGVKVPMGSRIDFIVTEKTGGQVPIPNLVCKKFDAAKFVVSSSNLNVGSIVKDATVSDQYSAYVWKQVPRYSRSGSIRIGEQVDIYLTQYRPDNCSGSSGDPDFDESPGDAINIEAPPAQPGEGGL